MSDAPERIWTIDGANGYVERGEWGTEYSETTDIKYVRADLYAALEVERDRMRERVVCLLHRIAQIGDFYADEEADALIREGGDG